MYMYILIRCYNTHSILLKIANMLNVLHVFNNTVKLVISNNVFNFLRHAMRSK